MDAEAPLTEMLRLAQAGDAQALHRLFDATYPELRSMARQRLRRNSRGTLLDTTALVHESFLRFTSNGSLRLQDRQHFLRYASRVMRSVVIDYVRERMAERRGGDAVHVTLNTQVSDRTTDGAQEILRVHDALEELAGLDERMAQVVEMRYFAGMTETEIAEALDVNERTVRRDWEKARLLLADALR